VQLVHDIWRRCCHCSLQLADIHDPQETYWPLHIKFCWLKWKHYSVSALLQMTCSAMIVTALSVLSYPTSRNQSHKFWSGKRGGQNPCLLHCHPKIVYKIVWDVVEIIPSFVCDIVSLIILCHSFKFCSSVMVLVDHADCSVVCCSVCHWLWMCKVTDSDWYWSCFNFVIKHEQNCPLYTSIYGTVYIILCNVYPERRVA